MEYQKHQQLQKVPMCEKHPIHEELKEIFRQALRETDPTKRKQLRLEGIRRTLAAPSDLFWKPKPESEMNQFLYEEAWLGAWDYFERKVHGEIRGKKRTEEKAYDPDKGDGSPITLWNKACKKKYNGFLKTPPQRQVTPIDYRTGEPKDMDDFAAPTKRQSIDELMLKIQALIEEDCEESFQKTCIRKTPPPPITCHAVLLAIVKHTINGEKWTKSSLAIEFGIPEQTMYSGFKNKLKPLVLKMLDFID